MIKITIENALEMVNYYNKKKEECDNLYKECKEKLINLDLDYIKENYSYKESKEIQKKFGYLIPTEISDKFSEIINDKKESEYPELLDAHYFVELKNLDMSKELRVILDKNLSKFKKYSSFSNVSLFKGIKLSDEKKIETIEFLKDKELIEEKFNLNCSCGDCGGELISKEKRDNFYNYHSFDYDSATEEEIYIHEDNFFKYGYFTIGCFNERELEICDINDFEEHLSRIGYKLLKMPDETLDLI